MSKHAHASVPELVQSGIASEDAELHAPDGLEIPPSSNYAYPSRGITPRRLRRSDWMTTVQVIRQGSVTASAPSKDTPLTESSTGLAGPNPLIMRVNDD